MASGTDEPADNDKLLAVIFVTYVMIVIENGRDGGPFCRSEHRDRNSAPVLTMKISYSEDLPLPASSL